MNTTLPRTSAASRLQAVFAAAFVTLAMLSAIDLLAATESAPALAAHSVAAAQA